MIGNRGITLYWGAISGATGYSVKVTEGVTEIWSKTLGANEFKVDIDEKIVPGKEYVFMVAALNGSTEGVYKGKKRRVPQPKHWWGHQADHTARYAKSVDIDNDIVYNAIESAVNEWNLELEGLNNHLIICASCIDSGTGKDKNTDGRYVVIKTVNNENDSIGNAPSDRNKGCGKSVACVKPGEERQQFSRSRQAHGGYVPRPRRAAQVGL